MLGAVARVRFLAVGDLMLDVVVSGRGHDSLARVAPGGSAAIAAAWAVEAGAEAAVVGRVGDDFAGRALREALERSGVGVEVSLDPDAPTGTFLLVDGDILACRGANARLSPHLLPGRLEADAILVSGYLPAETVAAALARARARWIALSPGPLSYLPAGANALLANEDEARRLTGAGPAQAARLLASRFRLACVSRGPAGAVAVLDGQEAAARGSRKPAAYPLGAGDALAAGLLVGLARDEALADALEAACRLGAAASASGPWPRG